jgi:hypothetical protein
VCEHDFRNWLHLSTAFLLNVRIVNVAQNMNTYSNYINAAPYLVKTGTPFQPLEDAVLIPELTVSDWGYPREAETVWSVLWARIEPGTTCIVITWEGCVMNLRNIREWSWKEREGLQCSLTNFTKRYRSRVTQHESQNNKRSGYESITAKWVSNSYGVCNHPRPYAMLESVGLKLTTGFVAKKCKLSHHL